MRAPRWAPLALVATAQFLLVFNLAALKISIEGIVSALDTSASSVKTALIAYSLVVAACIMAGARIAPLLGGRRIFRMALVMFGGAMAAMAWSPDAVTVVAAQSVAGVASAILTPASALLIAEHYAGERRDRAIGWLAAARSLSVAPALFIAGAIATWADWRLTFTLLLLGSAAVYALSALLGRGAASASRASFTGNDATGLALIGLAMLFIGLGSDNVVEWGLVRARPDAPFSAFAISPALLVIIGGLLLGRLALTWARRRSGSLGALRILGIPKHRYTLLSIFTIAAVSSGVTFLIPLYIEIVQGRTSFQTAIALIPFTASSFTAALLFSRLHNFPAKPATVLYAFLLLGGGLALLGAVVRNDWSEASVVTSLGMIGFGEGALTTLLLKGLAATASEARTGELEPLCDATTNLAAAVGAALAGALVIGVLGASVNRQLSGDPVVATELRAMLDLDRISFVSNDRLQYVLGRTAATPEQVANAVRINTESRLAALKLSFFVLAGIAFIGSLPAAYDTRRSGVRR